MIDNIGLGLFVVFCGYLSYEFIFSSAAGVL
jgi:hypothetical protein